jgi:L-threonate 2-dehydrogenase
VKNKTARSPSIGVIGLGIMGSAMATNLARAGFRVCGTDIVPARRASLKKAGGTPLASAAQVAGAAEVLITSLPSVAALHEVARELKARGRVVMETSTLPIDEKERARDTLAKKGIVLLDCPLSGTGAQARAKDLVVYASGERTAFAKAQPFMPGFSRAHHYLGAFGNGSKMKFVANLMVAIHNVSAAEAFALGMKAGLAPETIYKVQAESAGTSRMFQVRGPMMVAGKYDEATMKNELWLKDMKIIGEFATKLGVPTPLFNASAAIYNAAMAQGYAKQDTAAVCAVLEAMARVKR